MVALTFNLQSQVLRVGPIFENLLLIEMQVLSSISLLLFDVSIMLDLPIVNLFSKSHPWLHDAKKDAVLKNALCVQFNCHRKKYDKYNFFEVDVCANYMAARRRETVKKIIRPLYGHSFNFNCQKHGLCAYSSTCAGAATTRKPSYRSTLVPYRLTSST